MQTYTLQELSKETGKAPLWISNIQKNLKLPVLKDGYSESYLVFIKRIIAMQCFSISMDRIHELLETEKKVLKLLHIDSTTKSTTWYIDGCSDDKERSLSLNQSLLLTNFNLGFPINSDSVQGNLNFGEQSSELFKGAEMGEDVRKILRKYHKMLQQILQHIEIEKPALEQALRWAKSVNKKR